jgi:hypothetical protein
MIGCMMFANVLTMISVAYFDQSSIMIFGLVGLTASACAGTQSQWFSQPSSRTAQRLNARVEQTREARRGATALDALQTQSLHVS